MIGYLLDRVQIRASLSEPFRSHINLALFGTNNNKLYALQAPDFREINEAEPLDPSVVLTLTEAQTLMDDLWRCGLRPTEGTGSAGAMAAVQAHLEDMRRIVFEYFLKGGSV